MWISRLRTKINSIWLGLFYPFEAFGRGVSIHYSCEILRHYSHKIRIGDGVLLDREVWLNVPVIPMSEGSSLSIGSGTNVGRRCVISAAHSVIIEDNVLFAPNVFVTDHNHEFSDPSVPIAEQGITQGGRIVIERNCWIGYGAMIIASGREVIVGRNSVIGAYSIVTRSCPPNSVVVGNPAGVARQYDPVSGLWQRLPKRTEVSQS